MFFRFTKIEKYKCNRKIFIQKNFHSSLNNVILSRQEFLCVPETLHFLHSGCASYQSGSWFGMAWRLMHIIKWMINFCWNLNSWPENRTYQVWCQQLQTSIKLKSFEKHNYFSNPRILLTIGRVYSAMIVSLLPSFNPALCMSGLRGPQKQIIVVALFNFNFCDLKTQW